MHLTVFIPFVFFHPLDAFHFYLFALVLLFLNSQFFLTIFSRLFMNPNSSFSYSLFRGEAVYLRFLTFQLEQQAQCRYDYVEIIDPAATTNVNGSLGRFVPPPPPPAGIFLNLYPVSFLFPLRLCGKDVPQSFTSSSNKMIVVFQSDASVSYGGFMAMYSAIDSTKGTFVHSLPVMYMTLYITW